MANHEYSYYLWVASNYLYFRSRMYQLQVWCRGDQPPVPQWPSNSQARGHYLPPICTNKQWDKIIIQHNNCNIDITTNTFGIIKGVNIKGQINVLLFYRVFHGQQRCGAWSFSVSMSCQGHHTTKASDTWQPRDKYSSIPILPTINRALYLFRRYSQTDQERKPGHTHHCLNTQK